MGEPLFPDGSLEDFREDVRLERLVEALRDVLAGRPIIGEHNARMFLAFDQLDDAVFAAEDQAGLKKNLATLLAVASRLVEKKLAWCVASIATNQVDRLKTVVPGLDLSVQELPSVVGDLKVIVTNSFKRFRLPQDYIAKVVGEANTWLSKGGDSAPILPLVSVLMAELKRQLAEPKKIWVEGAEVDAEPEISLSTVLEGLGEQAWNEATRGQEFGWEAKLGRLLRHLVVTCIGGGGSRGLTPCRIDHPAVQAVQGLVEAMKRQRLLFEPDAVTLRLAHDAIIDGWQRAARWYEEDRKHQITLAMVEPRAKAWQVEVDQGRPGRIITDRDELADLDFLWAVWKDDQDLLPVPFLRACLLSAVHQFKKDGTFTDVNGSSRFTRACGIDDPDLLTAWMTALDAAEEAQRKAVIDHCPDGPMSTALFHASTWGATTTVQWLLDRGADPKVEASGGWTSLAGAAWAGNAESVDLLLKKDAKIDALTERQWTPLHHAAFNGHSAMVLRLIVENAEVNARTDQQLTPLQLAALNGHDDVIQALQGAGAATRITVPLSLITTGVSNAPTEKEIPSRNVGNVGGATPAPTSVLLPKMPTFRLPMPPAWGAGA